MKTVQGRIVDVKRHTLGFKIGGRNLTRAQAVRLARKGEIRDVVIRKGGNDELHIASAPFTTPLYDLPTKVIPTGSKVNGIAAR